MMVELEISSESKGYLLLFLTYWFTDIHGRCREHGPVLAILRIVITLTVHRHISIVIVVSKGVIIFLIARCRGEGLTARRSKGENEPNALVLQSRRSYDDEPGVGEAMDLGTNTGA